MTDQVNFTTRTTFDIRHTFIIQDEDANAYDMNGSTFKCDFRTEAGATAALELTSGSGLTLGGTDNNQVEMVVEAGDLPEGTFKYEIIRENGSALELIAYGTVVVEEGITT